MGALLMSQGTLVDATLIAAPNLTKNKERERDPEMHHNQTLSACFIALSGMASSFIRRRRATSGTLCALRIPLRGTIGFADVLRRLRLLVA